MLPFKTSLEFILTIRLEIPESLGGAEERFIPVAVQTVLLVVIVWR